MPNQSSALRQFKAVRQTSVLSGDNVYVDPDDNNIIFSSTTSLNTDSSYINANMYTKNYRIIKTAILVVAWVSFGLNYEMIGPTLEDLKVNLEINYSKISFGLVLRNFGYLSLSLVFGVFFDKLCHLSELFMAISSVMIGFCKKIFYRFTYLLIFLNLISKILSKLFSTYNKKLHPSHALLSRSRHCSSGLRSSWQLYNFELVVRCVYISNKCHARWLRYRCNLGHSIC